MCNANPTQVLDTLELLMDCPNAEKGAVIKLAINLWGQNYPAPRKPSKYPRICKGLSRRKHKSFLSLQRDHRAKRKQLHKLPGVQTASHALSLAVSQTADLWTPRMQTESNFQARKMARSAAETLLQGGALGAEVPHIAPLALAHQKARAKAAHNRKLAEERKRKALAPKRAIKFAGKAVYLDPSCLPVDEVATSKVITKFRMNLVECPLDAKVLVVTSPLAAAVSQSTRWIAILAGASLVDRNYFEASGEGGSCMAWTPAISTRRNIWFSSAWSAASPLMADLVVRACSLPNSGWKNRSETWSADEYSERQNRWQT